MKEDGVTSIIVFDSWEQGQQGAVSHNATVKTNSVWKGAVFHMLEQHMLAGTPHAHANLSNGLGVSDFKTHFISFHARILWQA